MPLRLPFAQAEGGGVPGGHLGFAGDNASLSGEAPSVPSAGKLIAAQGAGGPGPLSPQTGRAPEQVSSVVCFKKILGEFCVTLMLLTCESLTEYLE